MTHRAVQLVLSLMVLGTGVALLLDARLGSDGYSTLIFGAYIASGLPFLLVNTVIGLALIVMAWWRGTRPGVGTLAQPVIVGATVPVMLALLPGPSSLPWRSAELALAFVLLTLGVAGYLATDAGAGPTEAAALAFDPPVPFRWSYTSVQAISATVGWLLGAPIGPGTILVSLGVGPAVDLATRVLPLHAWRPRPGPEPATA